MGATDLTEGVRWGGVALGSTDAITSSAGMALLDVPPIAGTWADAGWGDCARQTYIPRRPVAVRSIHLRRRGDLVQIEVQREGPAGRGASRIRTRSDSCPMARKSPLARPLAMPRSIASGALWRFAHLLGRLETLAADPWVVRDLPGVWRVRRWTCRLLERLEGETS
jgi:hypothetical protein